MKQKKTRTLTDVVGKILGSYKRKKNPKQIISSETQVYKLGSNRKTPDVSSNLKNFLKLSTIVHSPSDWCN